ncbi:MAG: hypothetical protein Q4G62_06765 [Pseudomonadota bacterium]|nr:hypothetical protein [Pseudomonadota bacterium]
MSGADALAGLPQLVLDGEQARIAGIGAGPHEQVIAPGIARLARDYFPPRMPLALAMENAIADIEDALAQVPRELHGIVLASHEPSLHLLADAAGLGRHDTSLGREAVEHVFARQSSVALGRPAASEGLPEAPAFVPTLLLVRELMHHLDIASISIGPPTNTVPTL